MPECEECGKLFEKKRRHQVFCSPSCRTKTNHRKSRLRNPEYHKEWWVRNRDRLRDTRTQYERTYKEENNDKRLFNTCKSRAKKKGLEFNLEISDIKIPDVCPILGKPLVRCTPYAPSIDRIDPGVGYVKGNIQVISRLANTMKNNASPEDLRSFAQWALKTYKN